MTMSRQKPRLTGNRLGKIRWVIRDTISEFDVVQTVTIVIYFSRRTAPSNKKWWWCRDSWSLVRRAVRQQDRTCWHRIDLDPTSSASDRYRFDHNPTGPAFWVLTPLGTTFITVSTVFSVTAKVNDLNFWTATTLTDMHKSCSISMRSMWIWREINIPRYQIV